MHLCEAVQIVVDHAARHGENAEESCSTRVSASDSDADCEAKANDGITAEEVREIRDLWRAIEVIGENFREPVECAPR